MSNRSALIKGLITHPDCLDSSEPYIYKPERGLLAGILERAVRDLTEKVERHIRRDAIRWFKGTTLEEYVPFREVALGLELTEGQVEFILKIVHRAETLPQTEIIEECPTLDESEEELY